MTADHTDLIERLRKPRPWKGRFDDEAAEAIGTLQAQVAEYDKLLNEAIAGFIEWNCTHDAKYYREQHTCIAAMGEKK